MKFTPVYRCRLCGCKFETTPTENEAHVQQVMLDLTHGLVCTIQDAPRLLETHACNSDGSMGLADFLGLEAED